MKSRKPTELQVRVLERVAAVEAGAALYSFFTIHHSDQVISRAINLCCRYGWLRKLRDRELRLTAAGRKALEAGKAAKP